MLRYDRPRFSGLRLALPAGLALATVLAALTLPDGRGTPAELEAGTTRMSMAGSMEQAKADLGLPHDDTLLPVHRHDDPRTKNAISRDVTATVAARDTTTPTQRVSAMSAVERQRRLRAPKLTTVSAYPKRATYPATKYAMAGGCYSLTAPNGKASGTYYFKATRLGRYLLHTATGELTAGGDGTVRMAGPSQDGNWAVAQAGRRFTFTVGSGRALVAGPNGVLAVGPTPTPFLLRSVSTCPAYPEAGVDISGQPFAGVSPFQEVRGFVDAHTHGMAFEFLGGQVHCGRPWHEFGVASALVDCPDHQLTGGNGALLETLLSSKSSHDPVGWPTFKDWPAPKSLTHEGTYWRWLERSWRGGQRLFVNLLVENNKLCQVYPLKRNSCDDMDSIRLQAKDMYAMQDYIDAQFGGPGQGFYRIVRSPQEARRVINAGKMAVVMGIETSIPFGCTFKYVAGTDRPACSAAEIDANLDEMHRLGVRQMELVNKFDNALAGVAGDGGVIGPIINGANFLETGTFWAMEHCNPADGESHDNDQITLPDISAGQQDALFGAIGQLGGLVPALPVYPQPHHCNQRGLSALGAHTIKAMAKRSMIFDPDHLSVKARSASMDLIESMRYAGVVSSHSWSTTDTYPRIYQAGGFITPYAGDSTGFVDKWRRHLGWADPRYYFGFGYGADINGLGAQGDPRGTTVKNPVRYPFTGLGGVTVNRQRAGQRVWDINADGVAQYGLYPDWIEDLRKVADAKHVGDGSRIVSDMARGAEAYLQMWERATGIKPDSCRNANLRRGSGKFRHLVRRGMSTDAVMRRVGQPYERLGRTYVFCTKTAKRASVRTTVTFTPTGKVKKVAFARRS